MPSAAFFNDRPVPREPKVRPRALTRRVSLLESNKSCCISLFAREARNSRDASSFAGLPFIIPLTHGSQSLFHPSSARDDSTARGTAAGIRHLRLTRISSHPGRTSRIDLSRYKFVRVVRASRRLFPFSFIYDAADRAV